jgi:RNA recognition motif-containing protein
LDYKVDAKKLKQVFKMAGKVQDLDLSVDKDGNSRGFATITYDHPVEAVQAISMFDRQTLFDRRMTVRLDRIPDKSEGPRLPEGLKGIGIGLGPNGEPLKDVARNLPSLQNQNQNSNSQSMGQSAPAPVAPPMTGSSSILGPVPNANLSSLSGNLAALSNVVGLSNLAGNLPNSLLSNAAASLSTLGGLTALANASGDSGGNSGYNQGYQSGGFGSNRSVNDFDMGSSNVRSYNTQPNDDYGRSYGGGMNNGARNKISDTIVIRNVSIIIIYKI